MRPETLRGYALDAGFQDVEILPIDNFFLPFLPTAELSSLRDLGNPGSAEPVYTGMRARTPARSFGGGVSLRPHRPAYAVEFDWAAVPRRGAACPALGAEKE